MKELELNFGFSTLLFRTFALSILSVAAFWIVEVKTGRAVNDPNAFSWFSEDQC